MADEKLDQFMVDWLKSHPLEELPGAMLMKYGPEPYIGAVLAIRGTLYFKGSHTAVVREAICKCFDAYEAMAKEHLRWLWREDPPDGPDKLMYPKAKPMRDMLGRMKEDHLVSFTYTGGEQAHDASPWLFTVSGLRGWEAKMGGNGLDALQFSLPKNFVQANPTAFQKLFVDFSRLLKVEHGHGGFAFNLSAVREEPNEPTEAVMVSKMAGLDAGNSVIVAGRNKIGIQDHIKTVGWLTAINYQMVEKVGGLGALRSALPADWFAMYDVGSGLVVQAGPEPEIAAVEHDPKPAIYVLPNMAFKEVRVESIGSLHYGSTDGEPRLTGVAAEQWLSRFDVPEAELMKFRTKLLAEEKLTPESILAERL